MSLFHADTTVGGDGSDYTDDDNVLTGLFNGGHIIRLVPMFQQAVNIAKWVRDRAIEVLSNAAIAQTSATSAAQSVTQVNTLGSATGLQTTGSPVIVNSATPPTTGQVLTALTPTTASWQDSSIKKIVEKSVKSLTGVGTVANIITPTWLDADRVLLCFNGTSELYAVVYNRATNVFGTPVFIRATNITPIVTKVATDLVMIVSCNATTALEAVTLSISDTTITLNSGTKATATLAGYIASFVNSQIVESSIIIAYKRATTVTALCAITVSGTTPTIGAEVTLTTTNTTALTNIHYSGTGSIFRVVVDDTATTAKCIPVTVSGSTLTLGTSAQVAISANYNKTMLLSNGDILLTCLNTNPYAAIFKLTGTTEAVTSVLLNSFVTSMITDAFDCGDGKVAMAINNGTTSGTDFIILQDTAGTISKGTNVNVPTTGTRQPTALTLNSNTASFALTTTNVNIVVKVDVSGSSPSLLSVVESEIPGDNITGGYLSTFTPTSGVYTKPVEVATNSNGDLLKVSNDVYLSYYKNNGDSILRSENLPNSGTTVKAGYTNNEKILFTSATKGAFRIQIVGFTV